MGDSVQLICTNCKVSYPGGNFLPHLFIGRGIEVETNGLPSYCRNCKTFMVVTAENPHCKICSSKIQLLGDFSIENSKKSKLKGSPYDFLYDWNVLQNEDLGLTKEKLISKSKVSVLDRFLININPNWKKRFCLVFKIGINKFYHCPSCNSYAVKLYPTFVSWD